MSKMNFLDKARKKVEDAISEVQATATQLAQSRVYPPVGGYGTTAFQQPGYYPPAGHQRPQQQQQQQHQQHQLQQQYPHPHQQQHHGPYPTQPLPPPQQWQQSQLPYSPAPAPLQPYHPSPVSSPAVQHVYAAPAPASQQQQYYAPAPAPAQGGRPGPSYTPSPLSSPVPLHAGPAAATQQPQYFSPVPGVPGPPVQSYTPSPVQQPYYTPPPAQPQSQPSPQPQPPYHDPPPAYTPPLNDLLGGPRRTPPTLPPRRDSRAPSNASLSSIPPPSHSPQLNVQQPNTQRYSQANVQQPDLQQPNMQRYSQANIQQPDIQQPSPQQPNMQRYSQANIHQPNPQQPNPQQPNPQQPNPQQPNMQRYSLANIQQPAVQQPSVQPSVQQPNLQQPNPQQPNVHQPSPQQPHVQQSNTQQPYPQQPNPQQPNTQQPNIQQPYVQQPSPQQPNVNQPSVRQPSPQQPYVQQPNTQQPHLQQPNTHQPNAQQPGSQQSNLQQPNTHQSYAQPPNTQPPNTQPPNAQQPNMQRHSQAHISHPAAFELAAPEPSNQPQELAATEVQRPSNLSPSDPATPQPLALPMRQRHSFYTAPPVVAVAAPQVKLPCLATDGVRTKSTKFHIPKTGEDFSACDNCYRMYLAPYQGLVVCFKPYEGPDTVFVCDLSFGRVQHLVLTQCVPHSTLDPIRDFLKIMTTLTPCTGAVISSPGPFWITRNAVIPDIAICPTCFELYVRLTPFATHFETAIYPETRDWSCDIAVPYFKRLLRAELDKSPVNFANFAEEAISKFKSPPCPGAGKPIGVFEHFNKSLIFQAKDGPGGACPSCYTDLLELTPLEDQWHLLELVGEDIGTVTCDFAGAYSKLAMSIAVKRGKTEVWRTVVMLDQKLSPCPSLKGMNEVELAKEIQEKGDNAQWYQMTDAPSVLACPRCYWLFVQLFGAGHLCSPVQGDLVPGVIRQCSWTHSDTPDDASIDSADTFENSAAWRGRRLRMALTYGYESGDWTQLQSEAASIAKEPPPCPGRDRGLKSGSGRKWFGRIRPDKTNDDDATIVMCEECFVRTAKGRPGEALFNADLTEAAYGDEGEGGFVCQPYTNRARGFVRAAADSGELAPFARYWNNREALAVRRNKWLPILQQQNLKMMMYNQQTSLQMMLKGNAMANALAQKGSAGIVEAVSGETGYRYGNSQIGMDFMTQGSADAEQAWQNASNMQVGSGLGGPAAESMRLHALWEIDNQAFLAVE